MSYTIPTRNPSLAETYILASKAKVKLTHEARKPDINLRRLVVNANFLDNIMDYITTSRTNYNAGRFDEESKLKVTIVEPPAHPTKENDNRMASHFTEDQNNEALTDEFHEYASTTDNEDKIDISAGSQPDFDFDSDSDSDSDCDSDSDSDFDSDAEDYDSDSELEDDYDISHEYPVTAVKYNSDALELIVMGQTLMENQDLQFITTEIVSTPNQYKTYTKPDSMYMSKSKNLLAESSILAEIKEEDEEEEGEGLDILSGDITDIYYSDKFSFYQHSNESVIAIAIDEADDDVEKVSDSAGEISSAPSLSYSSGEEDELDALSYQDELESITSELVMVQSHPIHTLSSKIPLAPKLEAKTGNKRCSDERPTSVFFTEITAI